MFKDKNMRQTSFEFYRADKNTFGGEDLLGVGRNRLKVADGRCGRGRRGGLAGIWRDNLRQEAKPGLRRRRCWYR